MDADSATATAAMAVGVAVAAGSAMDTLNRVSAFNDEPCKSSAILASDSPSSACMRNSLSELPGFQRCQLLIHSLCLQTGVQSKSRRFMLLCLSAVSVNSPIAHPAQAKAVIGRSDSKSCWMLVSEMAEYDTSRLWHESKPAGSLLQNVPKTEGQPDKANDCKCV